MFLLQVWEASSDAVLSFTNPLMQTEVAHIVENDVLLDAVTRQLNQTSTPIRYNCKIDSCDLNHEDNRPRVKLQSGEQLSCNLLVSTTTTKHYFNFSTISKPEPIEKL
jgi:2-polyprenyl-6-methoxyphenol hydroxylase-like FAD-dependent oxidoreductase